MASQLDKRTLQDLREELEERQSIDVKRLRVYPTAVRCIHCQELFERTHAGGNHPTL